jgi:hypothetical protein
MTAGIGRIIFLCMDTGLPLIRVMNCLLRPIAALLPGMLLAVYFSWHITWQPLFATIFLMSIVFLGYLVGSFWLQRNLVDMFLKKII